jgi:hypothetical protein
MEFLLGPLVALIVAGMGAGAAPEPGMPPAEASPPPPPPPPQVEIVDATTPDRLAAILQEMGYRADLGTDNQGDPLITTAFSGITTSLYFYSCTDGADCKVIQFSAGFDLTEGISDTAINEWNRNKLFGTSYRDDDSDPWLKQTINLQAGVTPANVRHWVEWWEVAIGQFKDHIGF